MLLLVPFIYDSIETMYLPSLTGLIHLQAKQGKARQGKARQGKARQGSKHQALVIPYLLFGSSWHVCVCVESEEKNLARKNHSISH